jgi:phospholipid/cholesterol/gamma-HCH transport system substrate-binding protein
MARISRSAIKAFPAGLLALAVIVAMVIFGITASSGLPGAPTTKVRAAFQNVGASLQVGDDVRENSVRIGRVAALSYDGAQAIATLQLDGHKAVNSDAHASIEDTSALAKKFINLDRGHPQAGSLGAKVIPESRDSNSADLDNVLNVLDPKTRKGLTGTVRQAGEGVAGHSDDLGAVLDHAPQLLAGTGEISSALAAPKAGLPSLLQQADQLATSLNGHERQLSALVKTSDSTMRALDTDGGVPLKDSVKQLPITLHTAGQSFDDLERPLDDTRAALTDLKPGADALGNATPDLRGVLTQGRRPLDQVPGVAHDAEPAVSDLTKTVQDARPLIPALSKGLVDASGPVGSLSAYSSEVVQFFRRIESMVSAEVSPGVHGARVLPSIGGSLATGGVLPHALEGTEPYPAPGTVDKLHTKSPVNLLPGGNN